MRPTHAGRLVRLADRHLRRKLAGRVGGEDVVQSAFRTFLRRGTEGEFHVDGSARPRPLPARITTLTDRRRN